MKARMYRVITTIASAMVLAACAATINTLPPVSDASTPTQEVTLEIPDGLEIRSVNYSAAMYPDVSGSTYTSTTAGGRAFVQVLAVDRTSGEQVLLLYEDVSRRPQPIQIIRFRPAAEPAPRPE